MNRLQGSPIEWHESEEELVLHLPSRVGRMIRLLLGIAAFFAPFVALVAYDSNGWLFAVIGMAMVPAILLCVAYIKMRAVYLTDAQVTITPERVIVKAVRGGQETVQEFELKPRSRAWQWYVRELRHQSQESGPQGIVVADQTYNPEIGDDPNDRSKPRFGGNLTRGEMDWVEWRVNQFLVRNGHAIASESNKDEKLSASRDKLVRIEQDRLDTRIHFPNTLATGSYAGIGGILLGLVLLTICCVPTINLWNSANEMSAPQLLLQLAYAAVFGILGLASMSNGLSQLFGRRQLMISPQRVRYRASVLGIGVWWTLPTADVVSVWDPSKYAATRRPNNDIAGAQGPVIRTARRQFALDAVPEAVRSGVDPRWLADEISRHIVAARAQAVVL